MKELDSAHGSVKSQVEADVTVFTGREHQLWSDYRTTPSGPAKTAILEKLLLAHNHMLSALAGTHSQQAGSLKIAEQADYLQEAKIAAIQAYETYRPQSSSPSDQKFRNYIYGRVLGHLCTYSQESGLIPHPRLVTKWRKWLSGYYDDDPVKKAAFEEANNLSSESAREEARKKYSHLAVFHLESDFPVDSEGLDAAPDDDFVDELAAAIDMERALDQAVKHDFRPDRSKEIFRLICEHGMTVNEVASALNHSRAVVRESIHETRVKLRAVLLARN